jgi:F-type H+-transporting ATPase subunit b
MNNTALILSTIILVIVILALIALVVLLQRKLASEREEAVKKIRNLRQQYKQELENVMETAANNSVRNTPAVRKNVEKVENAEAEKSIEEAEKEAVEIIENAEQTAQSIISEAQERMRLMLAREEQELQKSIVKIVIQVVKRVLDKTLSYKEHKQIILEALERTK